MNRVYGSTMMRLPTTLLVSALLLGTTQSASAVDPSYAQRRKALMEKLGGGIAVVFGATGETSPAFRQDPDFYYLTGIEEPGAILILAPGEPVRKEVLLLPARDPDAERWTGERPPLGAALRASLGFEQVFRVTALSNVLSSMLYRATELHVLSAPRGPDAAQPRELELYGRLTRNNPGLSIKNSGAALERLRLVKDAGELAKLRRAIEITHLGLKAGIAAARPGATEFQVANAIDAAYRQAGARRHAYDPIVGCAEHSTILHHPIPLDRVLKEGELLLLDVGAEFEGYAADITRTIPVGGRFSPEQRKVYETVLKAQEAAFKVTRPGVSLRGDVDGAARKLIRAAGWEDQFIHGVGHFVGLEVHDRGDGFGPLGPGNIITIEPGIYLADRALGVRIEDEVLLTKDGAVYLSDAIPKSVEAIEAWASGR